MGGDKNCKKIPHRRIMRRPVIEEDKEKQAVRIKNRIAARKSAEKKNRELERLANENKFLKIKNSLLEERITRLERIVMENHSSLSNIALIQNIYPLVNLHRY
ncbi:Transcriptional activator hacA [Nosema granulosis]|uniref:Transcriptional activator hacA n=1 Tax=Nosema granulosis TaxID=83296 RepID=A0A9P6GZM6_9MICR|nr:Transcriptional activator hacA [Nosema granulosis]